MHQRNQARYTDDAAAAPPFRLVAVMLLSGMVFGAIIAPEPTATVDGSSITAPERATIVD